MKKTIMISFIIILFLLIVLMPVLLEFLIFRNNFGSVLDNGTWANFLGGYIGGVLGGISTLIAVYISTKETRRIQSDNYQQFIEEKKYREKQERKKFADEIVKDISKYITDLSNYFYNCRKLNYLIAQRDKTKIQLLGLETMPLYLDSVKHQIGFLRMEIDELNRNIEINTPDRKVANEYYFLLRMKLNNIEEGSRILNQLEYLHSKNYDDISLPQDFISNETDKLQELTVSFVTEYVK